MHRPIVIAGSREEFADWCRTTDTNPAAAEFVDDAVRLEKALEAKPDIWLWGNFRRNPAFPALVRCRRKAA